MNCSVQYLLNTDFQSIPQLNREKVTSCNDVQRIPAKCSNAIEEGREDNNVAFSGGNDFDEEGTYST